MATFVENARYIQILYANSIFLRVPEIEAVLVIIYDQRTKISSLKRKIRALADLPPSQPVRIEYMSGVELVAKTLGDAGLVAGDSVRARWE